MRKPGSPIRSADIFRSRETLTNMLKHLPQFGLGKSRQKEAVKFALTLNRDQRRIYARMHRLTGRGFTTPKRGGRAHTAGSGRG